MKKVPRLIALVLLLTTVSYAQVGIGNTDPKTTLHVVGDPTSTTTADGVQVPALTLSQLDAKIAAYGLDQDAAIVYINDVSVSSTTPETANVTTTGFYYYESSSDIWKKIGAPTTYSVGDFAQGGVVFWVNKTGQHGLVAAKADLNNGIGIQWFNGTSTDTGAKGDGIYAGKMNTMLIIANQGSNSNDYAAGLCANYMSTENGVTYGDWYLPSFNELDLMYQNKTTIDATAAANTGGSFDATAFYWSSTETTSFTAAFAVVFSNGGNIGGYKNTTYKVRAIRAF